MQALIDADVLVCLLKIGFFIRLNHQLVQHNYIGVRQALDRLQAKSHDRTAILYDLDVAFTSRYTIDPLRLCGARNLQVASPEQLAELLWRQYIAQEISGSSFSTRPPLEVWLYNQPYHRGDGKSDDNPTQGGEHLSEQVHPPTTRGTITICSDVWSNWSMRCGGLPGSIR